MEGLIRDLAFWQCSQEFFGPSVGDASAEAEHLFEFRQFPEMVQGCVRDLGSR